MNNTIVLGEKSLAYGDNLIVVGENLLVKRIGDVVFVAHLPIETYEFLIERNEK